MSAPAEPVWRAAAPPRRSGRGRRAPLEQLVAHDLHLPFHHPLDAPDAGVVVERRRLAGRPGHDDGGQRQLGVAVEEAAGVMVGVGLAVARRQVHPLALDLAGEVVLDAARDGVDVAGAHGLAPASEQVVEGLGVRGFGGSRVPWDVPTLHSPACSPSSPPAGSVWRSCSKASWRRSERGRPCASRARWPSAAAGRTAGAPTGGCAPPTACSSSSPPGRRRTARRWPPARARLAARAWRPSSTPSRSLAVRASAAASAIRDPQWAALKVKDGLVDGQRQRWGRRSEVARERPDLPLRLRLHRDRATLLLDTSGEPLDRRGYRAVDRRAGAREAGRGLRPGLRLGRPRAGGRPDVRLGDAARRGRLARARPSAGRRCAPRRAAAGPSSGCRASTPPPSRRSGASRCRRRAPTRCGSLGRDRSAEAVRAARANLARRRARGAGGGHAGGRLRL